MQGVWNTNRSRGVVGEGESECSEDVLVATLLATDQIDRIPVLRVAQMVFSPIFSMRGRCPHRHVMGRSCRHGGQRNRNDGFFVFSQFDTAIPGTVPGDQSAVRSERTVVPRDRIELSTPAFSGLCSTN